MPDQIARRDGQRRILGLADLVIALAPRLRGDAGIDIVGGAGHVHGTQRLDPGSLHGVHDVARHGTLRTVALGHAGIVQTAAQREAVGRPARQQHLLLREAARHLRQAHRVGRQPRRVHRIAHRQVRVIRHDLRGLGKSLLEGIGGIVGSLDHDRR